MDGETTVEKVIVVNRTEDARHVHDEAGPRLLVAPADGRSRRIKHDAQPMDAEDPLYILYTSGSTGKPKGILHTSGGYLTGVTATTKYIFDIKDDDVYWCTADVGWVTGHSYVVYGPLANGATVFLYEGAPDWPAARPLLEPDRKVRHHHPVHRPDRHSRVYEVGDGVARQARPVQPAPARLGRRADQPGSLALVQRAHRRRPLPDRRYLVADRDRRDHDHAPAGHFDDQARVAPRAPSPASPPKWWTRPGEPLPHGTDQTGILVITQPWPSMLRTLWRDDERYKSVYWSKFAEQRLLLPRRRRAARRGGRLLAAGPRGRHHAGRGPQHQHDGSRIGSGRPPDRRRSRRHRAHPRDQGPGHRRVRHAQRRAPPHTSELAGQLKDHVAKKIGAISRPDDILFTAELPKTRSGKIMRRLLRDIAEGRALGDTTTLADPSVVASLKEKYSEEG